MAERQPAIVVEAVSKGYGRGRRRKLALDRVSLSVGRGEVFGLIGPNGAGKTTLLSCLLGLLHHDGGAFSVLGRDPLDLAVRARTGYLPERLAYPRHLSGRRFLRFHHALARLPAEQRDGAVGRALERAELGTAADRPIRTYSRGMLQRLGLAAAALNEPALLVLDEPTSGMDPTGVAWTRGLVEELRAAGSAVLLSSHQLEQVERLCDRVAFIRAGRIERIETLTGRSERILVLRTLDGPPDAGLLAEAAAGVGARVLAGSDGYGRVAAADDAAVADLVARLSAAGVRLVEVRAEELRLERLFSEQLP